VSEHGDGARFGILGQLEARIGDAPIMLGPLKQRIVLALLLCNANSIVPIEALAEALWGSELPRTAYKNLQVYVSTLRHLLFGDDGMARLAFRIRGYQISVSAAELDVLTFTDLARRGRTALRDGQMATAARLLKAALATWRGEALEDLRAVPLIGAEVRRLEQRRESVYEDWIEAELALGHHHQILDTIEDLVRRHPTRERLRSAQFTAFYRCGRQAEALAEFDELRQLLARELGLQPTPALNSLYQAILTDDPSLQTPRGTGGPLQVTGDTRAHLSQLTRDLDDFSGRAEVTASLLRGLKSRPPARVTVITGPPGLGKTALAVHVGHAALTTFPDGQLLIRLRSENGRPRSATEVLGELLHAFGLGFGMPRSQAERAALYRSWLAERTLLIILDDAHSETQVRPLLPGAGGSAVIITSRVHLTGLEAARHVALEPFSAAEAIDLLTMLTGEERVHTARTDAERIAATCAMVPLAVRICGARLATQPWLAVANLADRLDDERRLLDELTAGDLTIRDCALEYKRDLVPRDGASFDQLGLLPANRFTPTDFASVANCEESEAEQALVRLAAAGVVRAEANGGLAFSVPGWLRAYARERVSAGAGVRNGRPQRVASRPFGGPARSGGM
jgi:DNA-binding SARP family transcriptional activator